MKSGWNLTPAGRLVRFRIRDELQRGLASIYQPYVAVAKVADQFQIVAAHVARPDDACMIDFRIVVDKLAGSIH